MNDLDQRLHDLSVQALKEFGEEKQVLQLSEENCEQFIAANNYLRGKGTKEELNEETADSFIMNVQMMVLTGITWEEIEVIIDKKLDKLERHIQRHVDLKNQFSKE